MIRRVEPSAALIPTPGQARLAYVPALHTNLRKQWAAWFAAMKAGKQ